MAHLKKKLVDHELDLLPSVLSFLFKKWANPGLFLFIFVIISLQFQ